jgi:hypothetical protein
MIVDRATLLAAYRSTLERAIRQAGKGRLGTDLAAYLVTLRAPTGYMLAVAVQRRYGQPDPDRILRHSLESDRRRVPVLFGVTSRQTLAELLEELPPRLRAIAEELRRDEGSASAIPVLVGASGGAELVRLELEDRQVA